MRKLVDMALASTWEKVEVSYHEEDPLTMKRDIREALLAVYDMGVSEGMRDARNG